MRHRTSRLPVGKTFRHAGTAKSIGRRKNADDSTGGRGRPGQYLPSARKRIRAGSPFGRRWAGCENGGAGSRDGACRHWHTCCLIGSVIADGLRYSAALFTVLAMGLALGFRPDGGVAGTVLAAIYVLFFAYSASWVFALIGNVVKQPETVSGTSMMLVYPLLFASNVLVDTSTMPQWLQVAVDVNPISIAVALTRGLFHGTADAADLAAGIGVGLLLIAVFAPLTIYVYLKRQLR